MFNLGSQVAFVHVGPDVSSSLGAYLDINGGFLSQDYEIDGELVGYAWHVVGAGSTTLWVAAVEGI